MKSVRILICDDEQDILSCYKSILSVDSDSQYLSEMGVRFDCYFVTQGDDAVNEVIKSIEERNPFSLIFLDINLPPGIDGITTTEKIVEIDPKVKIVIMSALLDYTQKDISQRIKTKNPILFYNKPFYPKQLVQIRDSLIEKWLKGQKNPPKKPSKPQNSDSPLKYNLASLPENALISKSQSMMELLDTVCYIANFNETVLIQGESGTGKEVLAHEIHNRSESRKGNFIGFNVAALPENLIESELFGHKTGAFTGATKDRAGRFELAKDGTIFIDEIGELKLDMQVKLLRVLQERSFEKIGGTSLIQTNARVLAATNNNLEKMVKEGTFRNDLYYRLCVIPLNIPPLRQRKEDIPILFNYFIWQFSERNKTPKKQVAPQVYEKLSAYDWPGNIRELSNIASRAALLSKNAIINTDSIQLPTTEEQKNLLQAGDIAELSIKDQTNTPSEAEVTKAYAKSIYAKNQYNKSKTARILGIDIKTLNKRLKP